MHSKLLPWYLTLGLGIAAPAAAEDAPGESPTLSAEALVAPENVCATRDITRQHWVDWTQDYLSSKVCGTAVWFDQFFGDERDVEENVDRYLSLTNALEIHQGGSINYRVRVRARIQLPKLNHKVHLILSDEDERNITETTNEYHALAEVNPDVNGTDLGPHSLGLRWSIFDKPESSFALRLKLYLNYLNRPRISGRYRYTYGLSEESLLRFTETVFWRYKEGVGETSRVDYERILNPSLLFRGSGAATYSEVSAGLEWSSGVSLYHSLSDRKAFSYDLSVDGNTETGGITQYRAGVRYRQNIFRRWLFVELEPAVVWPRGPEVEHKADPSISARVEIILGRVRHE